MAFALGAILFTAAIVLFVLYPVLTGQSASMVRDEDEPSEAESRKRVALRALRDVEYDYHTGKLDDRDYATLRGELTAEAVEALEVADGSTRGGGAVPGSGGDPVEEEIAALRAGLQKGVACVDCGHLNPDGSRFCARCGTQVAQPSATA